MYHLEIYEAGSKKDVLVNFTSKQPFLPINVGDYINQSFYITGGGATTKRLRTVQVEHLVWYNDQNVNHKVMIFTEIEK